MFLIFFINISLKNIIKIKYPNNFYNLHLVLNQNNKLQSSRILSCSIFIINIMKNVK